MAERGEVSETVTEDFDLIMEVVLLSFSAGVIVGTLWKALWLKWEVHDGSQEFTKGQQGGEVKDTGGGLRATLSEKAGQRDAT